MQGLLCGLEATKSGLRPIVLEANLLCGGASGTSLRILHGGLRHLQTLSLDRAVRSAKAQDWFRRHYAGFVEPIDVVLPLDGGLRRPPRGELAGARQGTSWNF